MAERLASIFGTEKDKVNCPFYFKIGACRHGDRCSRLHNKPSISQTLLLHNMYSNPQQKAVQLEEGIEIDDKETQQRFDEFYEDVFTELGSFGEIEEMHVTGNLGDHLTGNMYAKFHREEDAQNALAKLNGRFYAGRPIMGEFSPVTDFREARCRQYDEGECTRGGYCNFIHPVRPSRDLVRELFRRQRKQFPHSRSRSRSRSPSPRRRSRSRSPRRRGGRDYREERRDYRRDDRRGGREHGGERERDRDWERDREDRRRSERGDRDRGDRGDRGDREREGGREREREERRDDRRGGEQREERREERRDRPEDEQNL